MSPSITLMGQNFGEALGLEGTKEGLQGCLAQFPPGAATVIFVGPVGGAGGVEQHTGLDEAYMGEPGVMMIPAWRR